MFFFLTSINYVDNRTKIRYSTRTYRLPEYNEDEAKKRKKYTTAVEREREIVESIKKRSVSPLPFQLSDARPLPFRLILTRSRQPSSALLRSRFHLRCGCSRRMGSESGTSGHPPSWRERTPSPEDHSGRKTHNRRWSGRNRRDGADRHLTLIRRLLLGLLLLLPLPLALARRFRPCLLWCFPGSTSSRSSRLVHAFGHPTRAIRTRFPSVAPQFTS
jgi:hypothetical protein